MFVNTDVAESSQPSETFGLIEQLERFRLMVNAALEAYVSDAGESVALTNSMRYSLLAGGKRIRPMLVLAATEFCGVEAEVAVPAAAALEIVHTASLIQDDLPCMDNDDLRRGRPTNHRVFGEAVAMLAGDALFGLAFEVLSKLADDPRVGPVRASRATLEVAASIGVLAGGQALDLEYEGTAATLDKIETVHHKKTGSLIRAALRLGAICGLATDDQVEALTAYGRHLGLAFQIWDDVLGAIGDAEKLGKPVDSDARHDKATFVRLLGLQAARERALAESSAAVDALAPYGTAGALLAQIARWAVAREV